MKAFLALLTIDLKLARRNRAVLFFNYLFPLIFFFVFGQAFHAQQGSVILIVVTMVTVIGIIGNGLWGAGMRAVQEREENILRRYKVTPISPVPLLAASMVTGVLIYLPAAMMMLLLAHFFYGMTTPHNLLSFFIFVCIGAFAFRAIGLIVAAVVNSSQEANILIQLVYLPMLFLSGATFPLTMLPSWVQVITQFIPATYLTLGLSRILQGDESLAQNWKAVAALLVAALVGLTIATKLFRWEKEEKLRPAAKFWVVVVLLPFLFLGIYQASSKQELTRARILDRQMERGRTWLVQNGRIFVGNRKVIENGAVLIKQGKIAEVYDGAAPSPESLKAKAIDASGKTVLPGLIDVHVHLGAPGGFFEDPAKTFDPKNLERELAAYLYCGVTAVRSAGDPLDQMIALRKKFGSGEKLGAELFFCGPLFTAEGGHGTEYARFMPETLRASFLSQFVRLPKTPAEAKSMVDEAADKGVDAIKGVLESGAPAYPFNRMDVNTLGAVAAEAHARNLPLSVHTGKAVDVDDAIRVGADSIEHGSLLDEISDQAINEMKTRGIVLDPTLSVAEGLKDFAKGDISLLKRSLVEQVTTKELLAGSEKAATAENYRGMREGLSHWPISVETGSNNLLKAWRAGVVLVTGSDAGNFYVLHGPTVQREIELWVAAGIPIEVALEAATDTAAKLLRADNRIGTVEKGKEASLLIVDGNPLQDVKALSSISNVFFKGERVTRTELFEQK